MEKLTETAYSEHEIMSGGAWIVLSVWEPSAPALAAEDGRIAAVFPHNA